MSIINKFKLKKQQKELMDKFDFCEYLQTKYSANADFFRVLQAEMDLLDEQAEQIRRVIEGRVNDTRRTI